MINLSTGFKAALGGTGSVSTIMNLGFIYLFNGTQPVSADLASGTALGVISVNASNPPLGGLQLSTHASGFLRNSATWKTRTFTPGTVTWFRFVDSSRDVDSYSETIKRIDGTIGTDLILPSATLVGGEYQTVDTFFIVFA